MDEKFTSFHQYLRYSHKCSIIVFSIPGAIVWAYSHISSTFPTELAYLSMIFILEVQTTSKINIMLRYAMCSRNHASNLRLGSYDGAWYNEHNGTTYVTVSQILIEWSGFFSTRITFDRHYYYVLSLVSMSQWVLSHRFVSVSGSFLKHKGVLHKCLLSSLSLSLV